MVPSRLYLTATRDCIKFHLPPSWPASATEVESLDVEALRSFPVDEFVSSYKTAMAKVCCSASVRLFLSWTCFPCGSKFFALSAQLAAQAREDRESGLEARRADAEAALASTTARCNILRASIARMRGALSELPVRAATFFF